ncbi:MAG: GNAT family N-acetyltransferase [Flavobacteriales bacterium]
MLRLDLTHIPKLSTPRLILRELVDSDAPAVFQLRSNPEVMRFIPKPLNTHTDEARLMVREFHQAALRNESIMWGITVNGSNKVMGYIGFWRILKEYHRAEIGYALHPDLWGQGLMSEAVAATVDHGFQVLGLHSVEASVRPDNPSSIQVLERNGFVKEGYFKENIRAHGVFVDSVIYSRLTPVKASP